MNVKELKSVLKIMNNIGKMKYKDWMYLYHKVNPNYNKCKKHWLKQKSMNNHTFNNNQFKGNWQLNSKESQSFLNKNLKNMNKLNQHTSKKLRFFPND